MNAPLFLVGPILNNYNVLNLSVSRLSHFQKKNRPCGENLFLT
jgi:hypothetical protein